MPPPDSLSWWLQQSIAVSLVGLWLALLALLALLVRRHWPEQREWSRKLVHIGCGAVVPLAWLMMVDRWIAIPAAAAITLAAGLNHRHQLLPAIEDVGRASYGTVAYGASITLLLLAYWPQRADAVCAGVLVMAIGDGLAGLIGPLLRSRSWTLLGQRRSLAGTTTMALASLLVLGCLAAVRGGSPGISAVAAITATAVLLEQIGWGGLDNLTVPLSVAWLWHGLSG
jgi:phytol kinase